MATSSPHQANGARRPTAPGQPLVPKGDTATGPYPWGPAVRLHELPGLSANELGDNGSVQEANGGPFREVKYYPHVKKSSGLPGNARGGTSCVVGGSGKEMARPEVLRPGWF